MLAKGDDMEGFSVFTSVEESQDLLRRSRKETMPICAFFEEEFGSESKFPLLSSKVGCIDRNQIYDWYKGWMDENGHGRKLSFTRFHKKFLEIFEEEYDGWFVSRTENGVKIFNPLYFKEVKNSGPYSGHKKIKTATPEIKSFDPSDHYSDFVEFDKESGEWIHPKPPKPANPAPEPKPENARTSQIPGHRGMTIPGHTVE